MNILITGHCGFIGSALYNHLSKTHNVTGIDLKEGIDLLTCGFPKTVNLVIHLAGKSGVRGSLEDPASYWLNNVEASRRLFEFYNKTRIIYASSSSAYEPSRNPYAASKLMIEDIAKGHPASLGLRLHTVYSGHPREGMFFHKLLNNNLEYVTNHSRDFIHLNDVMSAFDLIINTPLKGVIDVGTGTSVQIQKICPGLPVRLNTPYERQWTCADITELTSLGFKPKYTVKDFLTINNIDNKI